MSIAMDGPAGAGKSTIAKKVAKELGYIYVDTGALYRTVALFMIQNKININDENEVNKALDRIDISMKYEDGIQNIYLNKENVNSLIRTIEVSKIASKTSTYKKVREKLLFLQKDIAKKNKVVMDGRDIGTVILPNADLKIFLTASAKVRGERRYKEIIERDERADLQSIIEDIEKRDEQDKNRAISPLRKANDAIEIDSSYMTIDEVTKKIISLLNK